MRKPRATRLFAVLGWLLVAVVLAALPQSAVAHEEHPDDGEFLIETVFEGLDNPTVVTFADDGTVFVGEKSGLIQVFDGVDDSDGPDTISLLPSRVHDYVDRGLLGLAAHPDFATTPYLYALYTWDRQIRAQGIGSWGDTCPFADDPGCVVDGRLSRIPIGPDNLPSGSEEVLIEDRWCQRAPGHSIGTVAFGPDGALYVGAGDGASALTEDFGQIGGGLCGDPSLEGGALRAQDVLTTGDPVGLNGAIIRVDPETGLALPDNPLVGNGVADDDEIIAYGLRNPYRFTTRPGSYDAGTGTGPEVYVSDTGWWRWEELNVIADASDGVVENFGWPCYAGDEFPTTDPDKNRQPNYDGENLPLCENQYSGATTSALTVPLMAYEHGNEIVTGDGCLTGGSSAGALAFYETGRYPHEYDGALFFSDYSRQCVWVMYPGVGGDIDPNSVELFRDDVGLIVDLKTGPGGDLYFVSLGEFDPGTGSITPNSGSLKRISYFTENAPPTAVATADPIAGDLPLEISFDGTGSTDPDEDPLTYDWDLDGDGQFDDSSQAIVTVTFTEETTVTVGLQVGDGEWTDTDFITISPGRFAPVVSIDSAPAEWVTGEAITLVGSGADVEDGALTGASLEWQISLHHCAEVDSCHIHEITTIAGATASLLGPEHEYPSFLSARLTATDSDGLTDSWVVDLEPSTVEVTIATVPPGLTVRAFNQEGPSPLTITTIERSPLGISTDDPQVVGAFTHQFFSWSDGGALSHDLVPTEDVTVTADFTYDLQVAPTWPEPNLDVVYDPTSLGLSWSGATDNAFVMGYRVFVNGQWMLTTPFPEYNLTGLDPANEYAVRIEAIDTEFNQSDDGPAALLRTQIVPIADGAGLVDTIGRWHLPDTSGVVSPFFFGVADDYALAGDWDCDGIDTPGLYRQSDGYAYLRNSNSTGVADVSFVFGIPGDVPIVGDFDGDGCDTLSVYRNSHVFIINELGENGGSLGDAELDYWFGVPGDAPFTGDFDGDGIDELGLFREASGFVYFTLDHPMSGPAFTDNEFFYGVPDDRIVAGDWTNDGTDTVGIFRESESTFYLRYSNSLGEADEVIVAAAGSVPVAGAFVFVG